MIKPTSHQDAHLDTTVRIDGGIEFRGIAYHGTQMIGTTGPLPVTDPGLVILSVVDRQTGATLYVDMTEDDVDALTAMLQAMNRTMHTRDRSADAPAQA